MRRFEHGDRAKVVFRQRYAYATQAKRKIVSAADPRHTAMLFVTDYGESGGCQLDADLMLAAGVQCHMQ